MNGSANDSNMHAPVNNLLGSLHLNITDIEHHDEGHVDTSDKAKETESAEHDFCKGTKVGTITEALKVRFTAKVAMIEVSVQ